MHLADVIDGELTHQDSIGNKETLGPGGVQYMSAGTGVVHSEMNDGDVTCRFLQIWLTPDSRGHTPQYGSFMTYPEQRKNVLLAILQGTEPPPPWAIVMPGQPIRLHQDATVIVSEVDATKSQTIEFDTNRQAYIVCINGSLRIKIEDEIAHLETREAAEVVCKKTDNTLLPMTLESGSDGAHFLLIEMKRAS
jgi:redox-sensitive bicupin YhaK (pirin superfamily)